MAEKKKNPLLSIGAFILLGVLIASFALWGVGGGFVQQGAVVAEVGDQTIEAPEFVGRFRNEVNRYGEQLGGYFDTQQALEMGVHRAVLDQMIDFASLDQEVEDLGLLGSDEAIQQAIMEEPAFQDITGNFSRFSYDQQLAAIGQTPREFEDGVRLGVARTQLLEALTETAVVPKTLLDTMFAFRKESRKGKIATIPASAVEGIEAPDEETLLSYFEETKDRYMHPEYRNVSYLILDPADFAEEVEISEEELQAEYEYRFDDFNTPEMRNLEVAIVDSEDEANELYARIQAGEDFAAVAAEISGFTEEELVLGDRSYFDIERDYSDVAAERVFNAPLSGVTEPTATLLSWQVFHVTNITAGVERPFESVEAEIQQSLAEDRGLDKLFEASSDVDNEIRAGSTVEQIGEALGLEVITVTSSGQGQGQDGNVIAETKIFPFLAAAFQADPFAELLVERFGDTDIDYVVQVNEIIEPTNIPLEEIRAQVEQLWIYEQGQRIAGERATEALAAVNAGESLENVAARFGGVSFETSSYRRDRVLTQRELDPAIANLLFSLGLNEAGIEADASGDGYILLQVTEITSLPPAQDVFEYATLLQQVQVEMKNDIFIQFQRDVEANLDISINNTLVEQLFDPDQQQGFGISQ